MEAERLPASDLQFGRYPFPKDDLPIEKKRTSAYGLAIADGIWQNYRVYGGDIFYNNRKNYDEWTKFALGKNDPNEFKPFLGVEPNANDKTWLKAINFEIKNYATKRVNVGISKMLSHEYDAEAENIDPLAVDAKEDIKLKLQIYNDNREWMKSLQDLGINVAPDGTKESELPVSQEDLELFMEMDYKTSSEIGMDLGIEHHLKRNKYEYVRQDCAFNFFVHGVAVLYVGMDENILPEFEWVDPSDMIIPFSTKPNFTELPYAAQVMWMTAAEFRKHASGYMKDDEIDYCIKNHAKKPEVGIIYTSDMAKAEDINKIAVLRYNYRTVDTVVKVAKPDDFGNMRLYDKDQDYYDSPKELEKFNNKYNGERKVLRKTYNTVYEGYWVINSKYVYRHGPRAYSMRKRGNFSEDMLGFKIFAPNSYNGHVVSTGQQMIPVLKELQRYNLKVQQLVRRAIPKVIGIDLHALRKANLKWDNKELTDQQKIEMFLKSGLFVFSSEGRFAPGSNYKPIFQEGGGGLSEDMERYLSLIQQALFELDEIIGINRVTAASSLPPDSGKAVSEIQLQASEVALDFLYRADRRLFQELVESLAILHVKSVKYGPKEYYDRIFGRAKTGVLYSEIPFDRRDYGFHIETRPTKAEWDQLYLSAEKAYDKGILRFADLLFLKEFRSIKQARRWLMKLEDKRANEQMQSSLILQEKNQETQDRSLQSKFQADKALEDHKFDLDVQRDGLERARMELQYDLDLDHDLRLQAQEGRIERKNIKVEAAEDRKTEKAKPAKKTA